MVDMGFGLALFRHNVEEAERSFRTERLRDWEAAVGHEWVPSEDPVSRALLCLREWAGSTFPPGRLREAADAVVMYSIEEWPDPVAPSTRPGLKNDGDMECLLEIVQTALCCFGKVIDEKGEAYHWVRVADRAKPEQRVSFGLNHRESEHLYQKFIELGESLNDALVLPERFAHLRLGRVFGEMYPRPGCEVDR